MNTQALPPGTATNRKCGASHCQGRVRQSFDRGDWPGFAGYPKAGKTDFLAPPVIMGERIVQQFLFLLLRAQKKKQEKGTPASPGPAGFPYFSPRAGRGKTRASPSNSSRVFSAPVCEARQDKWGGKENSHWHAAEHRRSCRKGDLHCLSAASLQSPGSIEEHRVSRLRRDKRHGGPFFGSFLWASKEMNKLISLR
jgi:hypothetical protein